MAEVINYRFRVRRRLAANWAALNEILLSSEIGHESDTGLIKIGDGVTPWNSLDYFAGRVNDLQDVSAPSPSDGDVLVYNATLGKWVASAGGGGGGGGALVKLQEIVVTSPQTDLTFTGLDLDADNFYNIRLYHVPNAVGYKGVSLYYNDDYTNGNYTKVFVGSDGSSAFGGAGSDPEICGTGANSGIVGGVADIRISKVAGQRAFAISNFCRHTAAGQMGNVCITHQRFVNTDNVVKIILRVNPTSGFGAGTRAILTMLT